VGGQLGDFLAFKENIALLRAIESVYAVEQAALAGTVGADDSQDLRSPDVDVNAVQGAELPE